MGLKSQGLVSFCLQSNSGFVRWLRTANNRHLTLNAKQHAPGLSHGSKLQGLLVPPSNQPVELGPLSTGRDETFVGSGEGEEINGGVRADYDGMISKL
ncbi:hypothetical protein NPIL_28921 [Nephila pilipes]|uniref:Uncharacterized protein n=1 Tax=Nephila pilipes TaxID=299642 RepID=A0A8X6I7X6_NEPPI|nr:hypothetical protein NPIL_28921 [Nephila pilipes]